ncbi:MAG: FAD-dependent oxidoreductase [Bacteroidia bacterium]|nr:FAD-dependent oxidoreductase [Bacteroidia bacterium]
MSIERTVDFIIVGQGLAGSVLAIELLNRDKNVLVYDLPDKNNSSTVAAGLFNPITGRIMTKTWKADLLFPFLIDFYSQAEKKLNSHFFHPMPIYRPFISIQEQNEWMGKSGEARIQPYIKQIISKTQFGDHVHDDFGGLLLSRCGYLDTNLFIDTVRKSLITRDSFRQEYFNENELVIDQDSVSYGNVEAEKIIYCNGNEGLKSRVFGSLPFKPLKGETIHVKIDQELERIYNRGVYIVPSGKAGQYKVGATYNPRDLSESITELGRNELSYKLRELIKLPFEITNQNWGMRPSTFDRRPFLGCHPLEEKVVIFNGLGTKGVSLAPYFANQLADWLLGHGEIDREVDIKRFKLGK